MTIVKFIAAAVAAGAVVAMPASAEPGTTDNAEALRKLDIMLMVTSLRCRTTADNFQADYAQFTASHLATMNAAGRTLQEGLVKQAGAAGARRALDRLSTGMANDYGRGHPWLGCGELKQITRGLAEDKDAGHLAASAEDLLSARPRGQWAMAQAR